MNLEGEDADINDNDSDMDSEGMEHDDEPPITNYHASHVEDILHRFSTVESYIHATHRSSEELPPIILKDKDVLSAGRRGPDSIRLFKGNRIFDYSVKKIFADGHVKCQDY